MGRRPSGVLPLLTIGLVLFLSLGCGAQDVLKDTVPVDTDLAPKLSDLDVNNLSDEALVTDDKNNTDRLVEDEKVLDIPEEVASDENDEGEFVVDHVEKTEPKVVIKTGAYSMGDENVMLDPIPETRISRIEDEYSHIDGRVAPSTSHSVNGVPYVITESRLQTIRSRFLYPFYDQGGDENQGDYQNDIHGSTPQIHKNFNFQLPFFGFRFNYTRVSMHGYLEFSDPPAHYTYPLTFPVKDWPDKNDPSFIGIFYSKCRIGAARAEDVDQRRPGVYFRMERDLQGRTDQPGVEMRERLTWDIRLGVIGAEDFKPKHSAIITWKNMTFAGGIDNSLYKTNTFQMILATDEVYTYAMFNYAELQWSSHTEAGGDTTGGEGGVPAYIGFNAGNGTQSFEYKPYSQSSVLRDLTERGYANKMPGRHIFRIDEKIMLGTCNKDIDGANLPLVFAPESGNMLGGTIVNITGPCFFQKTDRVNCRFDSEEVVGFVDDTNRAICVQPPLMAEGYVIFEVAINTENYKWKGKYFVETPATATERIFFETNDVHEKNPAQVKISWNKYNLTTNLNAGVRISLWGYKETKIKPELQFIDLLAEGVTNQGEYTLAPGDYRLRDNILTNDMQFGFIQINLTNPTENSGMPISPVLWSRPIPLGWYFSPQWERIYGSKWPEKMCNKWLTTDRYYKNFAADVTLCPCTLEHALLDKGRFLPDFECDKDANRKCLYNKGAMHCVRSGNPSLEGSGQQCCYDKNDYLMLSYDQQWGSRPHRSHNLGFLPWNEANKVPTLSHWNHDKIPFYQCCLWQEEQAVGCETYRFERRPTQDCVAYQPPAVGAVFGDPHIITFDNLPYTFNGKGEFVLARTDLPSLKLDVQGRFEQTPRNVYGPVRATQLTAVVAAANNSATVEVRLRPPHAQWRYRLDVFANGKRVYFDRNSLKVQHFPGVTVYTPSYILNQSEVVMMFQSGAGVEVVENQGFMTARVYLPWSYINKTRGLLGNWSWDQQDDFIRPDGTIVGINLNNFENTHKEFGQHWMLSDRAEDGKGAALFTREFGRTASYYANATFVPVYLKEPVDFLPPNRTVDINRATELCGESYQCRYDYGMSLNRDMAHFTKNYYDSVINIKETNSKRIISCGVLETPRFGRKTNFFFVPGTKVTFECNENFVLVGDQRRQCLPEGRWDVPVYGYTECLRNQEYSSRQYGLTGGIIMAVMIPILLILGCLWFCCIKRSRQNEQSAWNFKKFEPRSLSNSRANLRSQSMGNLTDTMGSDPPKRDPYLRQQSEPSLDKDLKNFRDVYEPPSPMDSPTDEPIEKTFHTFKSAPDLNPNFGSVDSNRSDASDLTALPKKRRSYEQIYRTNEPLIGHPNSEFPPKLWDLEEEDAASSGSNEGSDMTSGTLTKPAKDIQYISQGKPKQLGRRAQRIADSGYSTADKSITPQYVPYSPKYEDQYSPVSSVYSPSNSDPYSPSTSPIYGTSPKQAYYPNKFINPISEEPNSAPPNKLGTFALPVKKGKSINALYDENPNQQGVSPPDEIETFSSRTTMV